MDHVLLAQRLLSELQRAFRLEGDVPDDPKLTFELLPLWLERACAIGPVVILIDGVDQMSETNGEVSGLRWLPSTVPPNCSLVLTATSGSAVVKNAERRLWQRKVVLSKLSPDEKRSFISAVLGLVRAPLRCAAIRHCAPSLPPSLTSPCAPSLPPSLFPSPCAPSLPPSLFPSRVEPHPAAHMAHAWHTERRRCDRSRADTTGASQVRKTFEEDVLSMIVSADPTGSPLYLRMLLDEVEEPPATQRAARPTCSAPPALHAARRRR